MQITSPQDLKYLCNVLRTIHELNEKPETHQKHYRLGILKGKPVLDLNSHTASFHNVISCMKAIQIKQTDSEEIKEIKSTAISYLNVFKEKFKKAPPKECCLTRCFLSFFGKDRTSQIDTVTSLSQEAYLKKIETSPNPFLDLVCERRQALNDDSHPHYLFNVSSKDPRITLVLKKDKTSTFAEVREYFDTYIVQKKQVSQLVIDTFAGLVTDLKKHSQKLKKHRVFNFFQIYLVNRQLNKANKLLEKMKDALHPQKPDGEPAIADHPKTPGIMRQLNKAKNLLETMKNTLHPQKPDREPVIADHPKTPEQDANRPKEPMTSTEAKVYKLMDEKIVEVQKEEAEAQAQHTTTPGKEHSQPHGTEESTDPKVRQLLAAKILEVRKEQEKEEESRRLDFS